MDSYSGKTLDELRAFLTEGNVDFSKWERRVLNELQEQINIGKCELEKDEAGNARRVASLAKIFIYDDGKDLLLINPVNSFESPNFVAKARGHGAESMELFEKAVADAEKQKAPETFDEWTTFGQSRSKSENVEIPAAFVFETTFSPFKETPRDAAARVLAWRFSLHIVSSRIFEMKTPKKVKMYKSSHFPGLNSEYHVHHVKLKHEFVIPLQKAIQMANVTPFCLEKATNTSINTHWYCWIRTQVKADEMVEELSRQYANNEKVQTILGKADFTGDTAVALGKFMKEEAELLSLWG